VEELSSHRPWRVFEELPPPPEFLKLIDAGRREEGRLKAAPTSA